MWFLPHAVSSNERIWSFPLHRHYLPTVSIYVLSMSRYDLPMSGCNLPSEYILYVLSMSGHDLPMSDDLPN